MADQNKLVIDPDGCGCTDCITGYSVHLSDLADSDVMHIITGTATVFNRTSYKYIKIDVDGNSGGYTVTGTDVKGFTIYV